MKTNDLLKLLTAVGESGPVSWEDSEQIPLSDVNNLMNKKTLSPEWTSAESPLMRTDSSTRTLTFTAPEDLTIQDLIFEVTASIITATSSGTAYDYSHFFVLESLSVVSGTGPDVGYDVFEGNSGAFMGMFSQRNIGMTPRLNIRMDEGDVLELELAQGITSSGTPGCIPISMYFTYESGKDLSLTRKKILGGNAVETAFTEDISAGVAASATITVNSAPATEDLDFQRLTENDGIIFDLESILSSGAGTAGTNTYDSAAGTTTLLRDSIIDAINDSTNLFDDDWTASIGGAAIVTVTQNGAGASGNYDIIDTPGSDFTVTAFTGGTSTSVGSFVFTPTVDIVLTNIYYTVYSDVNPFGPLISPGYTWAHSIEITALEVDGVDVPIGRGSMPPMNTPMGNKHLNVPVSAGETIEVFARAGIAKEDTTILYSIVAEEV